MFSHHSDRSWSHQQMYKLQWFASSTGGEKLRISKILCWLQPSSGPSQGMKQTTQYSAGREGRENTVPAMSDTTDWRCGAKLGEANMTRQHYQLQDAKSQALCRDTVEDPRMRAGSKGWVGKPQGYTKSRLDTPLRL